MGEHGPSGLLAFVLGGLPTAVFLYWWTLPNVASSPPWWRSSAANTLFGALGVGQIAAVSLATVIVCAFLETLETRLDDNLVAPLGGACVMVGLACAFF